MRLFRRLLRTLFSSTPFYPGELPPLLYHLHPVFGASPVQDGWPWRKLPDWWYERPDEVWEETLDDWLRDLMLAVAARGEGKLYAEFSDELGVEAVARLPGCANEPHGHAFVCDTTPAAINALLKTNMSQFAQTVGADVFLFAADSWDLGVFLCVEDDDLLQRFSEPALEPPASESPPSAY